MGKQSLAATNLGLADGLSFAVPQLKHAEVRIRPVGLNGQWNFVTFHQPLG